MTPITIALTLGVIINLLFSIWLLKNSINLAKGIGRDTALYRQQQDILGDSIMETLGAMTFRIFGMKEAIDQMADDAGKRVLWPKVSGVDEYSSIEDLERAFDRADKVKIINK